MTMYFGILPEHKMFDKKFGIMTQEVLTEDEFLVLLKNKKIVSCLTFENKATIESFQSKVGTILPEIPKTLTKINLKKGDQFLIMSECDVGATFKFVVFTLKTYSLPFS